MLQAFSSPLHLFKGDTEHLFLRSLGYWYFVSHTLHTIFFCFPETHTIKPRRSLPRTHIFLRWNLAFKRTGTQFLLYSVSVVTTEETSHFCVHCHSTFVYLTLVLVPNHPKALPPFGSWCGTLRGEPYVGVETFYSSWNLAYITFRKEKYAFYWLHVGWNIASHTSQWSYIFSFWLRREMSGQALEFINPGINMEVQWLHLGSDQVQKPQWNQCVISFLQLWRKPNTCKNSSSIFALTRTPTFFSLCP